MVNRYISLYAGRSVHIEFPSDSDKSKIVRVCKEALKKLRVLYDRVLEETDSFDGVIQLMKDHATKHDLFLAVDNVWPESEGEARRLLGVGFTANSKILLTSRSEQVLQKVLFCYKENSYIGSLPTPSRDDARKIFQKRLNIDDFISSRVSNEIETAVKRCRFDGKYHPMALDALGGHLWRRWEHGDSETNIHNLSRLLGEIDHTALQSVHGAIKLNYDGLLQEMKQMFLDIALWIPGEEIGFCRKRTIANTVQWLRLLFEIYTEDQIRDRIRELRMAGVIETEVGVRGEEMIRLHDLYSDLAQKEDTSNRSLTLTEEEMEEMTWGRLERLSLEGSTGDLCMNELQQSKRPRLRLLYGANIKIWRDVHLRALRVLILKGPRPGHHERTSFNKLNLNGFNKLKFFSLQDCDFVESLESLSSIHYLQMLHIKGCPCLQNLDGLGCLTELKALTVEKCKALKELPNLDGMTNLERLTLYKNDSLEKVSGRLSPVLEGVEVGRCGALKELPDLGGANRLESLILFQNDSLEQLNERLNPGLKVICVGWCGALKELPDLGGVTGLERLVLCENGSLEEVSKRLGSALKEVCVGWCRKLRRLPDLGGVTGLERLILFEKDSLEEVSRRLSSALKQITIGRCGALKKVPDLGVVTGLQRLTLYKNDLLEEVSERLKPALREEDVGLWGAVSSRSSERWGPHSYISWQELEDRWERRRLEMIIYHLAVLGEDFSKLVAMDWVQLVAEWSSLQR